MHFQATVVVCTFFDYYLSNYKSVTETFILYIKELIQNNLVYINARVCHKKRSRDDNDDDDNDDGDDDDDDNDELFCCKLKIKDRRVYF